MIRFIKPNNIKFKLQRTNSDCVAVITSVCLPHMDCVGGTFRATT